MEIVIMICMLVVPFISVAAFIASFVCLKRFNALKKLVIDLSQLANRNETPQEKALNEFMIGSM